MEKTTVNMMSSATLVKGQGVGSAYIEQVNLVKENLSDKFEISVNKPKRADITHYHTINPNFLIMKPFRTKGGKSVGYVHMLPETVETSLSMPRFFKNIFYKYMIKFYKSMDYLVTVNPYFIDRLEYYGVPREKVTYIPNYVDSKMFHPLSDSQKKKIRAEYGLPSDEFTVVCAGQLQVRKGIFDFVEIAKRLPDIRFVWAGGFSFGKITDGYAEIKKMSENPPPNLSLLGIIDREKMNDIYNMGDVMFLPSFEELFPMTILEAMCANVPILLRDLDIYPGILFDFYAQAHDVDGFIEELEKLRTDSEYYEKQTEASKRGNEFYSKEHVAKMWDDFYSMVRDSIKAE